MLAPSVLVHVPYAATAGLLVITWRAATGRTADRTGGAREGDGGDDGGWGVRVTPVTPPVRHTPRRMLRLTR